MIKNNNQKGLIIVNALVYATISAMVISAIVGWVGSVLASSRNLVQREQAFQIAEAGIDYYRWRLSHFPTDYTDGNPVGTAGPFSHDFNDKDGIKIGHYELTITPPLVGSTVVRVRSKGVLLSNPNIYRTIEITAAIPSLAKYSVAANDVMRFGEGTEVFGPIHSNNGIRFDGLTHNVITSSKDKYNDPDDGVSTNRFGVYTTVNPQDPNPPSAVPSRPDVFMAGRQFPVAVFDFSGMTTDLANMKTSAQNGGRYFASSGSSGYKVLLKTNDTFDLYKVTSTYNAPDGCYSNQDGWGLWSVKNTQFIANYGFPSNGIIFFEDHVWVEGKINTARISIVAAKFPDSESTRKNIIVNNDVTYTNYDGQDVISLIAQGNFNVGLRSENDLRIDAAIIAQNGRAGRHYYEQNCSNEYYTQSTLTLYGMIATNKRYGFAYTDDTGYDIRNIIYDGNLLYSPPPSFPLTSSQYVTLSWEEVR